jgi:hypothetical protein
MVQVDERLPSKHKALSSSPVQKKKKKAWGVSEPIEAAVTKYFRLVTCE